MLRKFIRLISAYFQIALFIILNLPQMLWLMLHGEQVEIRVLPVPDDIWFKPDGTRDPEKIQRFLQEQYDGKK